MARLQTSVKGHSLMFEMETTLNRFLLQGFANVVADIPAERINERSPGDGHPPLWVLGHLAVCVELGGTLLGQELKRKDWAIAFGPGSSDDIKKPEKYSRDEFVAAIVDGYPRLCESAQRSSGDLLSESHGLDLLANTAIQTKGELLSHLLTSHFSFHLAQLSGWRRAAGHGPLF